jgi:hypothetical protein
MKAHFAWRVARTATEYGLIAAGISLAISINTSLK